MEIASDMEGIMNIRGEFQKRVELIQACFENQDFIKQVEEASEPLVQAVRNRSLVLTLGNGGSASQAAHFALDGVGRFKDTEAHPRPVLDLCSNLGTASAIGNDYSFGQIFRRQVMAYADVAEVVVGISTSGSSENVLNALSYAQSRGLHTILLTSDRCKFHEPYIDHVVKVPSRDTPLIQEVHIMVIHLWCQVMEKAAS